MGDNKMGKIFAISVFFIFIGAGTLFAQSDTSILLKKHTIEVGPEIFYFAYKEPDLDVKEEGALYGLLASYTYHNKVMLKIEGRGSFGWVDYSNSGKIDDILDYTLEIRGTGGYDFAILKPIILTPYIGIGYRYLNDDASGKISTTGAIGYERESNYLYSPIGLTFIFPLGRNWFVEGTGEYDYFWWGEQKTHLSDADPRLSDSSNRQKHGYGLRGSIAFQKKYGKLIFEGKPFIRYWNVHESKNRTQIVSVVPPLIVTTFEPKNNTTEAGVMFGVKF